MEKKNLEKEYKLNVSVIDFLKEIKEKNIKNENELRNKYESNLSLKFGNRDKVLKRVLRKEVKEKREKYLKEINFKESDFREVISLLIKNNKKRNYI